MNKSRGEERKLKGEERENAPKTGAKRRGSEEGCVCGGGGVGGGDCRDSEKKEYKKILPHCFNSILGQSNSFLMYF